MNFTIKLSFFSIILLVSSNLFAQYDFVCNNSFTYPNRMSFGEWKNALSLTLAKLPKDAIEEASITVYAPLLTYKTKIGLGRGFASTGNFNTNGITFHVYAGVDWSYHFNRITLGVGGGPAYFAGKLNAFGFDSKVKGLLGHNHFLLGIAFDNFTLTLKAEQTTNFLITQFSDNLDVTEEQNIIAGFGFSITIEQPLWKDNFMSLEIKANYMKFYYPVWAVFPTWERYNLFPEVIIGFSI